MSTPAPDATASGMRSPDVRIAFVGDSFTAGVGDPTALGWVGRVVARARAAGWDLTGYGLGVRRQTTPEAERRLVPEVLPRLRDGDAHGVVLGTGVNDTTVEHGGRRTPAADSVAALDRVVNAATVRAWPLLVVGPALVGDPGQNERIGELSQLLGAHCAHRGVGYVEVAAALAGDDGWTREVRSVDGAHPAAAGYARLAELVWPAFSSWLTGLAAAPPDR